MEMIDKYTSKTIYVKLSLNFLSMTIMFSQSHLKNLSKYTFPTSFLGMTFCINGESYWTSQRVLLQSFGLKRMWIGHSTK